jgi:predicted regulator of Ras-like GTPase activity (Roadblock/LC7/MglB family)
MRQQIAHVLQGFVKELPFDVTAVLASDDGLTLASSGCETDDAESYAAMVSGAVAAAKAVAAINTGLPPARSNEVKVNQVLVEATLPDGRSRLVHIAQAGDGSLLVVVAPHTDEARQRIPFAVRELLKRVSEHLGAAPRTATGS